MKVLLVNGSPKANGNTARALAEVAEQLNAEDDIALKEQMDGYGFSVVNGALCVTYESED